MVSEDIKNKVRQYVKELLEFDKTKSSSDKATNIQSIMTLAEHCYIETFYPLQLPFTISDLQNIDDINQPIDEQNQNLELDKLDKYVEKSIAKSQVIVHTINIEAQYEHRENLQHIGLRTNCYHIYSRSTKSYNYFDYHKGKITSDEYQKRYYKSVLLR